MPVYRPHSHTCKLTVLHYIFDYNNVYRCNLIGDIGGQLNYRSCNGFNKMLRGKAVGKFDTYELVKVTKHNYRLNKQTEID